MVGAAAAVVLALVAGCGGGSGGAADTSAVTIASGASGASVTSVATQRVSALAASTSSATVADASAWTACATEGGTCAFSGQKQVRYGKGTTYVTLTLSNSTACTNAVFGDPTVGVVKSCSYADLASVVPFDPTDWAICASEGGVCSFNGINLVRYGTANAGVTLQVTSQVACSNTVFGDPAVGVTKTCWVSSQAVPTWTLCAAEGQSCAFSGTRVVRYGTATQFNSGSYSSGVPCTNAIFGDPVVGTAKSCSYSSVDTSTGPLVVTPQPVAPGAVSPLTAGVSLAAVTAAVVGSPLQLNAVLRDAKGSIVPGAAVTWSIVDPSIASVNASGMATPLRPGFSVVTATSGSQTASGVLTVRGPTPIPVRSQYVGTNPGGIVYYGTNFPFADLMKSGGGWGSSNGAAFPSVSADGYPTSLAPGQQARAPVAWTNTSYPVGRYTLLWDGAGTMSFPLSRIKIDESGPNRMVVESTDPTSPIFLGIDTTDPANPVRNVRFLMPGTESTYQTQPFNPDYLVKTAPFSMLRFMDWGATNGSPLVEWADRPLPSNATYATPKGVPIEVMIDLANSLHIDPWFCIPHMASDDYVRQFAILLHNRLDPTLRPHIEYSNEMWNTGFPQTTWAKAQSVGQGLSQPWGTPSIFYAKRAVQMFKVMQQVYGTTDSHRLVRVLAGQAAWLQFLQNALNYADTAVNVDVMSVAPYFVAASADNPANVVATLASTPSQIVDQFLASIRGNVRSWMTANGVLASQYHLTLKAYESGPGDNVGYFPSATQDAMTALFAAANASPRMRDVYTEYYGQWKSLGGDTMNQYADVGAWSKWGFWGALQYVTQNVTTSPKYQGLLAFIMANPTTPIETVLDSPTSGTR